MRWRRAADDVGRVGAGESGRGQGRGRRHTKRRRGSPLDRAVKLGDLIDWPQQLEASGRPPQLDPVHVDVRVPPDLATWRGPGVPLVLKLQYTPPACAVDAYVEVSVNDQLIESQPLRLANAPIVETKEALHPVLPVARAKRDRLRVPLPRARRARMQRSARAAHQGGRAAGIDHRLLRLPALRAHAQPRALRIRGIPVHAPRRISRRPSSCCPTSRSPPTWRRCSR